MRSTVAISVPGDGDWSMSFDPAEDAPWSPSYSHNGFVSVKPPQKVLDDLDSVLAGKQINNVAANH